jgi:alkaline phosphatase
MLRRFRSLSPENNSFAVIEIDKDLNIYIEGFYNCKNKEMKHNR